MFMAIKVSVIIPFYKVAPFIGKCAKSLMEQTLQEVEFIFVDDASPDDSRKNLEQVLSLYNRDVHIVTHPENKGLPAARNTGMALARGEYVFHCDSDDYAEPDMLEKMYAAGKRHDADIVYCDFYLDFGSTRKYMETPDYESPEQMIKAGFLAGAMKYNVWNKLAKRVLYTDSPATEFPSGHSMGEDMTMIRLAVKAKRITRVPDALYHYMKTNGGAFTNTFSEKNLADILFNSSLTIQGLETWDSPQKELYINLFKLNLKLPFLMSGSYSQYLLWQEWYPEANQYINKNLHLPFRTRLLQNFAYYHLFPLVWLYFAAVNKLFYRT